MASRSLVSLLLVFVPVTSWAGALDVKVVARQLGTGPAIEIVVGETPVMRLRGGGADALARAQTIRDRLWQHAVAGIRPAEISVTITSPPAVVIAGQPVVTVTSEMAKAAGATAHALAASWAKQLKTAFAQPYLALETQDLLVPYQETRTVAVGGSATGPIETSMYAPDIVQVTADKAAGKLVVRGLAVGTTAISVRRGDADGFVQTSVRKWAATFGTPPEPVVTGNAYDEQAGRQAALNAVVNAVRLEPGAALAVQATPTLGSPAVFSVSVEAAGAAFIPVRRALTVAVNRQPSPAGAPAKLLISNDPETVEAPGDLLVGTIEPLSAARLLYHHKALMPGGLRLVVAVDNVSPTAAAVHVLDAPAGPHPDELFVGHLAARRFLDAARAGEGLVLWIPPGRSCQVLNRQVGWGEVLSGLANLTVLTPTEVRVSVFALPAGSAPAVYPPPVPEAHLRMPTMPGTVFEPVKLLAARYEVGGGWLFLHVGKHGMQGADGHVLDGDYGVDYDVEVEVVNPTAQAVRVEVAVRAGGGTARGLFHVDGTTVETGLLRGGQEHVLQTFPLDAGQSRRLSIRTMPEAASSYPVTLIVRSR